MADLRQSPAGFLPNYDGKTGTQCTATCGPYRCVLDLGHTGEHFTYGIEKSYIFDNTTED